MRTKTGIPRFLNLVPRALVTLDKGNEGSGNEIDVFWDKKFHYPRVSPGAAPLTKKREDSGYEIGAATACHALRSRAELQGVFELNLTRHYQVINRVSNFWSGHK